MSDSHISSEGQGASLPDLEWISVQKDIRATSNEEKETTASKLNRKLRENPLVPIGCLATATVLGFGLRSFIKGNRVLSQKMMRYRILSQGLTVAALMVGVYAAGKNA